MLMADQRRDPDQRPSPDALARARRGGRRGRVGKLRDLRRCGARRRQDLRDAADRARPARGRLRRRRRRRRDPRPQGDRSPRSKGSRSSRAGGSTIKGHRLEEMDLDAILARRPQIVLVDELAHTNAAGQPPPQALSRCRGAAEPRHRRLYHGQHPAHREPERRRRADHRACGCARPCRTRSSTAPMRSSWST